MTVTVLFCVAVSLIFPCCGYTLLLSGAD